MPLHLALIVASIIVALAWRARTLRGDGALAAVAIGVAVLWGAGWGGGAVLVTFFLGTTLLEVGFPSPAGDLDFKEGRRDARQVLANGAAGAAAALLVRADPAAGFAALTAGFAAAAGDTWATTVGKALGGPPRDLLRHRPVPRGASGGVTWVGTAGGVAGSALVAGVGAIVTGSWRLALVATAIGSAAMGLDSLLGSAAQGQYRCRECGAPSESGRHACGGGATLVQGVSWLDNDGVNALATWFGALAGYLAWRVLPFSS